MKILNNIPALRTLNQLNKVNNASSKTMLRLSSGLKINSAADDAAGLAIGRKMDTQVKGLQQANRNAMDGISMIQTAEGAYNEVHAMLQRMRELTVQAANTGTYEDVDKEKISAEIVELQKEILSVQGRIEFNKKTLLSGSENEIMLQIGPNQNQAMRMTGTDMNLDDVLTSIYGIEGGANPITLSTLPNDTTIDVGGVITKVPSIPGTVNVPANTLVTIKIPPDATLGSCPSIAYTDYPPTTGSVPITTIPQALSTETYNRTLNALPVGTKVDVGGIITEVTGTSRTIAVPANTSVVVTLPSSVGTPFNMQYTEYQPTPVTVTTKPGDKLVFRTGTSPVSIDTTANPAATFPANSGVTTILPNNDSRNKCLIDFTDDTTTSKSLDKIDQAIETTSKIRGRLGAYQNRLEHTVNNLQVSEENTTASMSRIMDADMAAEMATYTQQNILSQAATSILAQANQRPGQVLQLLQR